MHPGITRKEDALHPSGTPTVRDRNSILARNGRIVSRLNTATELPMSGSGGATALPRLFRHQHLRYGRERRLGLPLTVPEQRIVRAPPVEPRVAIAQSPERDARDVITVLEKDAERVGIASRQRLLHLVWKSSGVRIGGWCRGLARRGPPGRRQQ